MDAVYIQPRSEVTRQTMMRAFEKLAAKKGIDNVSVKDIIKAAKQKNESALHYHFKNRQGLIDAVIRFRVSQIMRLRSKLFAEMLAANPQPSLRDICEAWVRPTIELSLADPGFLYFTQAMSVQNVLAVEPNRENDSGQTDENLRKMNQHMLKFLQHIDEPLLRERALTVIRLAAVFIAQQSRLPNAFKGTDADVSFNHLLDIMESMFAAKVSAQTRKALSNSAKAIKKK